MRSVSPAYQRTLASLCKANTVLATTAVASALSGQGGDCCTSRDPCSLSKNALLSRSQHQEGEEQEVVVEAGGAGDSAKCGLDNPPEQRYQYQSQRHCASTPSIADAVSQQRWH